MPLFAPGLGDDIGRGDELTAEAVKLTRIMLLSPLLLSVSGMITGILNARQHFFLPALAPSLYNIGIIVGALALAGRFGVEGLAIGVVAGSAAHLVIQIPGLVRERMRYGLRIDLGDAPTREVARLMAPRVLGLAAAQANFVVTTTFFASKVGTSAISGLTFAWLIASLPVALFGIALSTAAFPTLAEHEAAGDRRSLLETVSRVLRTILFFSIPAALGLAFLREPATMVLLERGAFGASDTAITSAALGFLCLSIVPQAAIEIHSRGFYALGDTRTPVLLTVGAGGGEHRPEHGPVGALRGRGAGDLAVGGLVAGVDLPVLAVREADGVGGGRLPGPARDRTHRRGSRGDGAVPRARAANVR